MSVLLSGMGDNLNAEIRANSNNIDAESIIYQDGANSNAGDAEICSIIRSSRLIRMPEI